MDGFYKIVKSRFDGGFNNSVDGFLINENEWQDGQNFVLNSDNKVAVRNGFIKLNRQEISGTSGVVGLFRFYLSSGTAYWVCVYEDAVYYFNSSTAKWAALTCDFTINSNQRTRFVVYNDLLIMVNGSNYPFFWDGNTGHNVHRLGIPAPVAGPSGGNGGFGSGSLDTLADYFYKYTYYNSETGHESNGSDANASAFQTVVTGQIRVTIPQNSAVDAQVDKIRLYRTEGGGASTDSYYWTGVDYDVTGHDSGDLYLDDTVADSALSTELDWSDHAQPGYSGGTDFKYALVMREKLFLAGESSNPSRVYGSKIGYPCYFNYSEFYNFGLNDGDVITGISDIGGNLVVYKERSVFSMYNPYNPDLANVVRTSDNKGLGAPDSLCKYNKMDYFVDIDGVFAFNGFDFFKISGNVNAFFDDSNADSLPLPVRRTMRGVVWNGKLLLSYGSKGVTTSDNVVKLVTQNNSDSGDNRKAATLSADYGETSFESGTDARMALDNDQSDRNKLIEVEVFIPFDETQISQHVWFAFFFSYNNGVSWRRIHSTYANMYIGENIPGFGDVFNWFNILGSGNINPIRRRKFVFYDSGVTDVRLDFYKSAANGIIPDENDPDAISYINLERVSYYYDDSSVDSVHDRVIAYNLDSGKWDAPYVGVEPGCWAIGDKKNDLNELHFGGNSGFVYQYGVGEYDDGDEILAHFKTKHYGNKEGLRLFFDRIKMRLLAEVGEFTLVVYVDMVERLRKTFRSEGDERYFMSSFYNRTAFGGSVSLIERVVSLAREGSFVTLQFIRLRHNDMPMMEFEIEGKVLEE